MQLVIDGLEQVVQREPTFNAARVALSQIWLEEGNLEEAIEWMERAINQGSSQPKDYFNLGQLYLRVGDLPAAKDEFAKALEGNLDEMEAHLALASLALQAGDKAVAQNHLDQIPQLTYVPRSDTYFDKTASQFYPMTVEAMAEILRSQLAFEDGNLPKAIEHLEKNVTAHEDADRHSPFEYYLLGLLYSLMDDAEKAQENWTRNEDNFILFDLSADPELSLKISNVISALAWFDLVEDCGESDIMEWGSENNPCLPNKIEDRIAAIYERFHQWLPYRMYYIKHRSEALMYLP
jgi:tetratricopeptide (TPR) repeat protein